MDGTLEPFDRSRLEEIKAADPAAVILNGYYCGHLGEDMSLDELTAGVRYHYENSMNDLDGFIGAHDDRLPPEVIEEAKAAAHAAGLPFSEKPYRDGEDLPSLESCLKIWICRISAFTICAIQQLQICTN